MGIPVASLALSAKEASDLRGLIYPLETTGKSTILPPDYLPLATDDMGKDFKGMILFFDEIHDAEPQTQAAAQQIVLEHRIDSQDIHPLVHIVTAGNKPEHGGVASLLPAPLNNRMVHFELNTTSDDWLAYAAKKKISISIRAYIGMRPSNLFSYVEDQEDPAFCTPRSLFTLSDLIDHAPIQESDRPYAYGTVGVGIGSEIIALSKITLPKISDLLAKPDAMPKGMAVDALWLLGMAIGDAATTDNLSQVIAVVDKIDMIEIKTVVFASVIYKLGVVEATKNKAVLDYFNTNRKFISATL
jgi:uncharacterized protein YqcC (DUF446 family)